jgi:hypothetical protein
MKTEGDCACVLSSSCLSVMARSPVTRMLPSPRLRSARFQVRAELPAVALLFITFARYHGSRTQAAYHPYLGSDTFLSYLPTLTRGGASCVASLCPLSALQHPYTIIFFNTNNTYHHVSNSPYNRLLFVFVLELPTNDQYCLEQLQETNEEGST